MRNTQRCNQTVMYQDGGGREGGEGGRERERERQGGRKRDQEALTRHLWGKRESDREAEGR